jgi:hypothetical protein
MNHGSEKFDYFLRFINSFRLQNAQPAARATKTTRTTTAPVTSRRKTMTYLQQADWTTSSTERTSSWEEQSELSALGKQDQIQVTFFLLLFRFCCMFAFWGFTPLK